MNIIHNVDHMFHIGIFNLRQKKRKCLLNNHRRDKLLLYIESRQCLLGSGHKIFISIFFSVFNHKDDLKMNHILSINVVEHWNAIYWKNCPFEKWLSTICWPGGVFVINCTAFKSIRFTCLYIKCDRDFQMSCL